jgi:hypothetical protein
METINIRCRVCHIVHTLIVDETEWELFMKGERQVQDAFPHLTPGQRELFVTQICDICFDKMMPQEE